MLVKNLDHLIELATNTNRDFQDFHILIAGGLARSSKRILYDPEIKEFSLFHEIDESCQEFHLSEIGKKSNLIEAIKAKALFKG